MDDFEGEDGNLWFEKVDRKLSSILQGSAKEVWNSRTWFGLATEMSGEAIITNFSPEERGEGRGRGQDIMT